MNGPGSPESGNSGGGSAKSSTGRQSTGLSIPDALSVEEHGRLWNAYREGKYFLPNDGDEQDRLDLQHQMWRLLLRGNLHLAPIKKPAHVLDIGTGTGIWAIEFARLYPESHVTGTDISLIQPTTNLPPNCHFVREDSEELWVHDKAFDYIHWRLMVTCFHDHKAMIFKVFENLVPGGWAEFHDWAPEMFGENERAQAVVRDSPVTEWLKLMALGGTKIGRDFMAPLKYKEYMEEAGFVDIVVKQVLAPVNVWPQDPIDKAIGGWLSLDVQKGVKGTSKILHAAGMPMDEIPNFTDKVSDGITYAYLRAYMPHYVFYGRRPVESQS